MTRVVNICENSYAGGKVVQAKIENGVFEKSEGRKSSIVGKRVSTQ